MSRGHSGVFPGCSSRVGSGVVEAPGQNQDLTLHSCSKTLLMKRLGCLFVLEGAMCSDALLKVHF